MYDVNYILCICLNFTADSKAQKTKTHFAVCRIRLLSGVGICSKILPTALTEDNNISI